MIGTYPNLHEVELADQATLAPLFRELRDGLSELTFAGVFCFREAHGYRLTRLADGSIVLVGADKGKPFFICPFSLPETGLLDELFRRFTSMKLVTEAQVARLRQAGYRIDEDRDNFDYLYRREDLATLAGRALQKKRNLVHAFVRAHEHESHLLSSERKDDALAVLEAWRANARDQADYHPARDALMNAERFGLQGQVCYVERRPVAYTLGEPIAAGGMFVVHYEKTVPAMKGLYQFINMNFACTLPTTCALVNREQDLGDAGLRQAKLTYRPCGFVKKKRAHAAG